MAKQSVIDTQEQINHCLNCKMAQCINCLNGCKVGQIPGNDPCLTCRSKRYCRSGVCNAKARYEEYVKQEKIRIDQRGATEEEARKFLKKGDVIYINTGKARKKSKVLLINRNSFTTADDDYYFTENGKLWWFTEGKNEK